jgi:hypothetical protein
MPAGSADFDVFEIRKPQQYMRGYNSSLVQSDLRRIGLLLMYNRYYKYLETRKHINSLSFTPDDYCRDGYFFFDE